MVKWIAQQRNRSRRHNSPFSVNTCDLRFLPHRLLYLHIIRKRKRIIGEMKSIPTCTNFLSLVGVSLIVFSIQRRPLSSNVSHAALSLWQSRTVCSVMESFQSGVFNASSVIQLTQRSNRRSNCLGPVLCLLLMLINWAIIQTCSLTLLFFRCIVKPPFCCQITMVSAAHWLHPTPAFSAQRRTHWVGIWFISTSATIRIGNQKASHYIVGFQWWAMIEWWISNAHYSKQVSGVLNISSRVMRCGSRRE